MTRYFIWNDNEKIENEKIRDRCIVVHNCRDDHMVIYRFNFYINPENSDGSIPKCMILNGKNVELFETIPAALFELNNNKKYYVLRFFVMPGEGRPNTEYNIEKVKEAFGGRYYIYSISVPISLKECIYWTFSHDPVLKGINVPLFVSIYDAEKFVLTLDNLYCKYEVPSSLSIRLLHSGNYVTEDCSGPMSNYAASIGKSFFKGLSRGLIGICLPEIKEVKFNPPATIVFWDDDTKTVVKTRNGEKFDPEKGLSMAISKKALGNEYDYYETFKKEVGKYNKKMKKEEPTEVKKEIQKPKKSSYSRRRKS